MCYNKIFVSLLVRSATPLESATASRTVSRWWSPVGEEVDCFTPLGSALVVAHASDCFLVAGAPLV